MKTVRYILTGIMLCMLLPFGISQSVVKTKQVFILKSVPGNTRGELLAESKEIMVRRLTFMGLTDVTITSDASLARLVITVGDPVSEETLSDLLRIRGDVHFYETLDRKEILQGIGKRPAGCLADAYTLLHISDTIRPQSESVLGIANGRDSASISACLSSASARVLYPGQTGFLWSSHPVAGNFYNLYCISSSTETVSESDILEAHADVADPEHPSLSITLKENARRPWSDATARNINRPMAFVMDNKVYAAPRILDVIPSGMISLTGGGFSTMEIRKLAAIISSGTLPLKFIVERSE